MIIQSDNFIKMDTPFLKMERNLNDRFFFSFNFCFQKGHF